MLLNVHIKNIALIDDANVNFTDNLNILTGETGAGKSIIMGALKIGMGDKLPKDIVREPDKEGFCQLLFLVDDPQVIEQIRDLGVEPSEDGEILITRRINNSRTINTINDMAVTAAKLREVSALLIDMHTQHQQQTLLKKAEHMKLLDKYGRASIDPLKQKVAECHREYVTFRREMDELSMDEAERSRKVEFLKYQIAEIESANIKTGEDEDVEHQYNRMVNSRDIVAAASDVYSVTGYESSSSAGNEIGRALASMKGIKDLDGEIDGLYSQLENIDALLNDFNVELNDYMQSMDFDDSEFRSVESRLDVINDIKGKYGSTVEEVFKYLEDSRKEYERLSEYDEYISGLSDKIKKVEKAMLKAADALTAERQRQAENLCRDIRDALADLSFMEVRFDMVFDRLPECTANGIDDCYFVISTNVGEKMRPLYDVASGGELSRIMLAIKSCMASEDNIGTLVFDEIDVGISGRAAQKVAEKMAVISRSHQVISITHLPQIAAMADSHYLIEKSADEGKTVTRIVRLNDEESTEEIARLLGGVTITEAVMSNAREMKQMAEKTKKY
ncbi:DNA repair protein RecN [Coprococcus sp. RTP31081st1_D2_RTP31081_211007]|jgi:DNA repair protein RecN|uniref:DNA repair protein RecN n=1 Tax=unclassified Coprococcus TaxID=2684943 RepID=UPI000E98060A|nr:DNA repair protein RecN [Coprococcus sp.]HBN39798.1 DNA repair protein RecN [Coprococcus sp.]